MDNININEALTNEREIIDNFVSGDLIEDIEEVYRD